MEEILRNQNKCLKELYEAMNKELAIKEKMIGILLNTVPVDRKLLQENAIKELEREE